MRPLILLGVVIIAGTLLVGAAASQPQGASASEWALLEELAIEGPARLREPLHRLPREGWSGSHRCPTVNTRCSLGVPGADDFENTLWYDLHAAIRASRRSRDCSTRDLYPKCLGEHLRYRQTGASSGHQSAPIGMPPKPSKFPSVGFLKLRRWPAPVGDAIKSIHSTKPSNEFRLLVGS
jgi:hypothetical protein